MLVQNRSLLVQKSTSEYVVGVGEGIEELLEEMEGVRSNDAAETGRASARLIATRLLSAHTRHPITVERTVMSTFDTVWPADSVEFCPHPAATDIFVCGTYKLDQPEAGPAEENTQVASGDRPKQHRRGKCLLFGVNEEGSQRL